MALKQTVGASRCAAVALLSLSFVGANRHVTAQPTDEQRALSYASTWHHGLSSIPDSTRRRVAGDRVITDLIEATLLGRRTAPPEFDNAVAVWWLSESGRVEYLPTLLRFSADSSWNTATHAIYGLLRHLDDESVRARLLEIDASGDRDVRNNMATLLARVNNNQARALLARLKRQQLSPNTLNRIDAALRVPPESEGRVRWPCLQSERVARKPGCTE